MKLLERINNAITILAAVYQFVGQSNSISQQRAVQIRQRGTSAILSPKGTVDFISLGLGQISVKHSKTLHRRNVWEPWSELAFLEKWSQCLSSGSTPCKTKFTVSTPHVQSSLPNQARWFRTNLGLGTGPCQPQTTTIPGNGFSLFSLICHTSTSVHQNLALENALSVCTPSLISPSRPSTPA